MKPHDAKQQKEVKNNGTPKKTRARWESNHPAEKLITLNLPVRPLSVLDRYMSDWYVSIRTNRTLGDKKQKQHPSQGDDAGTTEGATRRVVRGEQGETRPAISAPRGGPHLDLGHLRLKTWSKSDFSTAGTTWRTLSPIYLRIHPMYMYCCSYIPSSRI